MVFLQAKLFTRLDHNAFHLKTLALVDALIPAPGAEYLLVREVLAAIVGFQPIHQFFHILHPILVRDQHHVRGFDDDQIRHAQCGYHSRLGAHKVIRRVFQHHVASHHVACHILVANFPQCGPRTDIVPADIGWNNRGARGALHHRVVHRLGRTGLKCRRAESEKIEVPYRFREGRAARVQNIRSECLQLGQKIAGAKQEHAAVPKIVATGYIALRSFQIGFFNERGDMMDSRIRIQGCPFADIAITRFRRGGLDAKRRQLSGLRRFGCAAYRGMEGFHIANQVVGR